MSDWQRLRDVPLTGADCFLRAFDADTRRRNGAGHLSQLVLRLGPGFDLAAFRAAVVALSRANPILRAPVVRPFGLGAPRYRTTRPSPADPPVLVHPPEAGRALPGVFATRLNDVFSLRRGDLLRFDVVPREHGTDLAMTWAHLLLDGHGSEKLVALLDEIGRGARPAEALDAAEGAGLVAGEAAASWRARGDLARRWQRRMHELGDPAPRSLAPRRGRVRQQLRCDVLRLSLDDTAAFQERAKRLAGFLTPVLFPLAASLRAHAAVLRKRGEPPVSFVVPVVANARPRGERAGGAASAIFRTHVSMLWFRVLGAELGELEPLVATLKAQRLAMVQSGFLEQGLAALDFARFAPAPLYAAMARRTFHGELASFFFAYTGEFLPGTARFFGAPVEHGFHVPSVPASPGSGLISSLHGGRLTIAHVWQPGVASEDERFVLRDELLADLVGQPRPALAALRDDV